MYLETELKVCKKTKTLYDMNFALISHVTGDKVK